MSYVYVIQGREWTKIGISECPKRRFNDLRFAGAVALVRVWHRPTDARIVEHTARFLIWPQFRHYGREWFTVSAKEAVRAVSRAIAYVDGGNPMIPPGLQKKRDHQGQAPKLSPKQVGEAQKMRDRGLSVMSIAKHFKVAHTTIYNWTFGPGRKSKR